MTLPTPDLFANLTIEVTWDAPLGPLTWYGVGGTAVALARPADADALGQLVARCHAQGVPIYILGSGANLLVADDVPGVVVLLDQPEFSQLTIEGNTVTVGAGYDLMKLVRETARVGLAGLEVVAGIPASIGGALRMNAGGTYGEVGTTVSRVRVMSAEGEIYDHCREDLVFSYRHSNIEAPFIIEADFELEPGDPKEVMNRVKEVFMYKKNTQPMGENSSGCGFKNPPAEVGKAAGQLIDEAGLKGFRIGKAWVSDVHANFLCVDKKAGEADPKAAAADLHAVFDHVHQTVLERFDVDLKREVVIWP